MVRSDKLKIAKGVEALGLDFVVGPGKAAHRLIVENVFNDFGEIELVADQRARQVEARLVVGDAHDVAALDARRRAEIVELVFKAGQRAAW